MKWKRKIPNRLGHDVFVQTQFVPRRAFRWGQSTDFIIMSQLKMDIINFIDSPAQTLNLHVEWLRYTCYPPATEYIL